MSKWEIKKNSSSDGKSEVYENGVKIGTISKERGIPFISSDQAVVRNSSGDKIGIVSSQDDGVIGGLLGHKKTIVDDLRKKRISNPKQSQFPVETQSSIGPSYSGGSGNSGGSSYSPTISVDHLQSLLLELQHCFY